MKKIKTFNNTLDVGTRRYILTDLEGNSELPVHFDNPDQFLKVPGDNSTNGEVLSFYDIHKFCNSKFELTMVDEDTISKIMLGIKSNSEGYDEITADMVLLTQSHTIKIITDIINTSTRTFHQSGNRIWYVQFLKAIIHKIYGS